MAKLQIKLAAKLATALTPPLGTYAYRAFHGGRGSAKSFSVAKMAAIFGAIEPLRILCVREFQVTVKESFHAELKAAIASEPWLEASYDVGTDYLRGRNGTEFIFRGLRRNTQSIKSLAKIDLTIVEEAEDVPEESWLALEATVFRQPRSELWAIWNPRTRARKNDKGQWEGSPVDARFRQSPPPRSVVVEVNHRDNPFFPPALEELRKREQERLDPDTYNHVWEGGYLENSDRQVLAGKWRIAEFEPGAGWDGPYQGIDFGYVDPLAAVRCWVHDERLWVEHEAYKTHTDIDAMAGFVCERIPRFAEYTTRADSAEPKTISYAVRNGLPRMEAVKKWPNSVTEGVRFLRSFREIVVHPRCKNTANECRLYSYDVNKAGDVLPDIIDANNHAIDAIRYAIAPLIKAVQAGGTTAVKGLY